MPKAGVGTIIWPGSKTTIAPWIIDHMPPHRTYIEPFGGSASVLMQKDESDLEVFNDLDGRLVEFFEVCRDRGDELADWLTDTPYSREVYERFKEQWQAGDIPDSKFKRAAQFFYLQSCSYGGKGGTFRVQSTTQDHSPRADRTTRKYLRAAENLADVKDRFSEVLIEQLDYTDLIPRYDSDVAFFYCDPPYHNVDYYRHGTDFDHSEFADVLDGCEGRWMVSYSDIPPAFDRDGWHVVERTRQWRLSDDAETTQVERLVMNYDPNQVPAFSSSGQTTLGEVS